MAVHIPVEDNDDRPERMVRDPDRYFADARRRAEQELTEPGSLLGDQRHRPGEVRGDPEVVADPIEDVVDRHPAVGRFELG